MLLGTAWCNNQQPPRPACQSVKGVVLDDVLVQNNAGPGVSLDGVLDHIVQPGTKNVAPGAYAGFANRSCIANNMLETVRLDGETSLSNPYPGTGLSDAPCFASYRGGACPDPGGLQQVPAPSYIPGWLW